MKAINRLLAYFASLALIDLVTWLSLDANMRSHVYPTTADTIIIPLVETATSTMLGAGMLLAVTLATSFAWPYERAGISRSWRYSVTVVFFLLYAFSVAFFSLWSISWFGPHHYLIAVSCLVPAMLLVALGSADLGLLLPNNSFKPKPLRGSA